MTQAQSKKLVWVHDRACSQGGVEAYIRNTVKALRAARPDWEHHLLYSPGHSDVDFIDTFDSAWAITDTSQLLKQLQRLQPQWVYLHQLPLNIDWNIFFQAQQSTPWKTLRFLHDHKLFCLREHKYTALKQKTCTRATGTGCYGCLGFVHRREGQWQFKRLGTLQALQQLHHHFDALVVGSPYMVQQTKDHGLPEHKVHLMPLYYQRPSLSSPVQTTPTIPTAPFRLLFVGQLLQGKGLDILFRALHTLKTSAQCPDFRLDILGRGSQEQKLKDLVHQLGLQNQVHFAGWVEDKSAYWQAAQALVLPSRTPETFGLVGLEAMAHGIPVIASDVGGIRTWLTHGYNGDLFPSGDVRALANCLRNALHNPKQSHKKGQQGYALWQRSFQPQHHIQPLIRLLEQLEPIKTINLHAPNSMISERTPHYVPHC